MPPKSRLPPEQRRLLILQAARRTFLSQGFGGATVRGIAVEADIDQAMIYRHFPSKEDLFEEAIAAPLQRAVDELLELSLIPPATQDDDVRDRSVRFLRDLIGVMREIAPLLGVILTTDPERADHFYRERIEPALSQIRDVIVSNAPLYPHRDFDPDLIARIFFGTCWYLALDERHGTRPTYQADDLAPEILSVILDGLIARNEP